jgi:hypothetical protein
MSPAYATLQRRCACGGTLGPDGECAACRAKRLQRRAIAQGPKLAPPIVHKVLRGPGQPLDTATRSLMEPRFGHDFSRVRVHTDSDASESARRVGALAYTVGQNIVFAHAQFRPDTPGGIRLVAHELAHVVQQGAPTSGSALPLGDVTDPAEREAATAAEVASASSAPLTPDTLPVLRRQETGSGASAVTTYGVTATSCTPAPGPKPTLSGCAAYLANLWWLPSAYVNNATCACLTTPDSPTANCVRGFLQMRLASAPAWLKALAVAEKPMDKIGDPILYPAYQAFVQTFLAPRIYQDHVDAYSSCCCSSGPAPYPAWMGVTSVPIQPCSLVGLTIRLFGACHAADGSW